VLADLGLSHYLFSAVGARFEARRFQCSGCRQLRLTTASIPGRFLKPSTETGLEVLARERSGNQTISAVEVTTK
jgi:hypothetical protein